MCVIALKKGDKPVGAAVIPCAAKGSLCIRTFDDEKHPLDKVTLKIRHSETTKHTDRLLSTEDQSLYVDSSTPFFQINDLEPGIYEVWGGTKKNGYTYDQKNSGDKFEIVADCYTVIELRFAKEVVVEVLQHIDKRIIIHKSLFTSIVEDICPSGENVLKPALDFYCKQKCIDFPALLKLLSVNGPEKNAQLTLLGMHDFMPLSPFDELVYGLGIMPYGTTALKLKVDAGNRHKFLPAMHENGCHVIFMVPPKPFSRSSRTADELKFYMSNPHCTEFVTFVFGAYNSVSKADHDLYFLTDRKAAIGKQLFQRFEQFLLPETTSSPMLVDQFKKAKEEQERLSKLTLNTSMWDKPKIKPEIKPRIKPTIKPTTQPDLSKLLSADYSDDSSEEGPVDIKKLLSSNYSDDSSEDEPINIKKLVSTPIEKKTPLTTSVQAKDKPSESDEDSSVHDSDIDEL